MILVSEETLPFETMEQILAIFPSWSLAFLDGMDIHFKLPAMQVCIKIKLKWGYPKKFVCNIF